MNQSAAIEVPVVKKDPVKLAKNYPKKLRDSIEVGIYINDHQTLKLKDQPWFRADKHNKAWITRSAYIVNGLAFIYLYSVQGGELIEHNGADIIHVKTGTGILEGGSAIITEIKHSKQKVWEAFKTLVNADLDWDNANFDRLDTRKHAKGLINEAIDSAAYGLKRKKIQQKTLVRQEILDQIVWQQDEWGWRATVAIDGVLYDSAAYSKQIKKAEHDLARSIVNNRRGFIRMTEHHFRLPASL